MKGFSGENMKLVREDADGRWVPDPRPENQTVG
jgi:hypothetical protein